jgi:hypothetical protein
MDTLQRLCITIQLSASTCLLLSFPIHGKKYLIIRISQQWLCACRVPHSASAFQGWRVHQPSLASARCGPTSLPLRRHVDRVPHTRTHTHILQITL